MARGYRRPKNVPAEIRKVGRAVEKGAKQAKEDIAYGGRELGRLGGAAARKVREGVRKIKRATGR